MLALVTLRIRDDQLAGLPRKLERFRRMGDAQLVCVDEAKPAFVAAEYAVPDFLAACAYAATVDLLGVCRRLGTSASRKRRLTRRSSFHVAR